MTFQLPDDGAPALSTGRPLPGITAEVADPSDELVGDIQNRVKRELAAREYPARSSSSRSYRKRLREDPTNELRERTD